VFGHRHTPEITQVLSDATDGTVSVAFAPHLAPMDRGLLADVYLPAANGATLDDLHAAYARRYADEPFVHVHEAGRLPSTAEVRGSNRAHLGVAVDEGAGMMMIACAIDNLVKGAAGQAVQCANIVLGEPETAGLDVPSPIV
jgi:N-acetyl-gamma-glutamyl-phosphate reductase